MLDKAESLDTYEAEYARKQRKKRRMRIVILCTCALTAFLCYFLFKPIPWSAEDLDVEAVVEDGVVWVYANSAQSGGKVYGRSGKSTFADMGTEREIYYIDYENEIEYTDYHIHFEDSRWGLLFHPVRRGVRKLYTDGSIVGETTRAVIGGMVDRRSRLIYDNPDGTYVVLWECEEVSK